MAHMGGWGADRAKPHPSPSCRPIGRGVERKRVVSLLAELNESGRLGDHNSSTAIREQERGEPRRRWSCSEAAVSSWLLLVTSTGSLVDAPTLLLFCTQPA